MFDNKFLKKDPLVEAVKQAQADGDMRRQAIATVNEQFGVYSRNAVIRENLAAYDAAVEEAYKCMKEGNKDNKEKKKEHEEKVGMEHIKKMGGFPGQSLKRTARSLTKEEMKLADKDYDRDGKREKPKDEVWGSRFRAARLAGKMEEEQIDEMRDRPKKDDVNRRKRDAVAMKLGHNNPEGRNNNYNAPVSMLKHGRKLMKQGVTREETDYSAQDRAPVTKSAPKEDPSTPKSYPGAASSLTPNNPTTQRMSNAVRENVTAPKDWAMKRQPNKGAVTKAPVPGVSIAEEDQINEISKELAGKYIKHADYKRSESSFQSGKVYGKELATKKRTKQDVETARKHNRDSYKREKGVNMAVNKLTGRAKVQANEAMMESIKAKLAKKYVKEDQSF
jgi:hypothetical protein